MRLTLTSPRPRPLTRSLARSAPRAVPPAGLRPGPARGVLNIAHRGASEAAPENTLAALRRAIAADADLVEVDVQRTADGVPVLMHDTTLARTTDVRRRFPHRAPWRVADFRHDEIRTLDAGGWKSPVFAGERVPTLEEALDVLRPSATGLLAELKAPELYPGIVADVAALVGAAPGSADQVAAGRLVVQSFDVPAMKDLKTRAPWLPVGLLGAPARANLPALASWADQVNPRHSAVDAAYVAEVHRLGMGCLVWTVNRRAAMRRALRLGVDGVITNRPEVFGPMLAEAPDNTVSAAEAC